MSEKGRYPTNRAGLSFDIIKREIALRCRVEFNYLRYGKPLLKILPDVRPKAVSASHPNPMLSLCLGAGSSKQITAELSNVLNERAIELRNLPPKGAG